MLSHVSEQYIILISHETCRLGFRSLVLLSIVDVLMQFNIFRVGGVHVIYTEKNL